MRAIALRNLAVLLLFWLPAAYLLDTCNVTIHPQAPVVVFGGSVTLNCTTTCTNYTRLSWEVSVERVTEEGRGWTTLKVANVSEWDLQPLCLVKSGTSDPSNTRAVIYAYHFSAPDIYLASTIVANHSEKIVCNISSLRVRDDTSPSKINISLSKGNDILKSSSSISSVEYSFVAQLQEDGDDIFCVAYLQVGPEVLKKSTKRTLKIAASPYNVRISTESRVYKKGTLLVVQCQAEGKPSPEFSWDLPSKDGVEYSESNKTITIRSAQKHHNGTYRCLARNIHGSSSAQVDISYEESSRTSVIVGVLVSFAVVGCIVGFIIWYCKK